ncbi:hypothetical protein J3R83DRAFT_9764 [Lanmaoa asiatica]|nr:hypothetical protein J3R83DRAFT_9764 [Lanmaoa asiatica]
MRSSVSPSLTEDSTTAKNIATLQAKLNKKLGPEYISQRPGPGGGLKLTYAEGWKIINLANEVFGFNGWSSSIVSIATDFLDYSEESRRFNVGVTAIVRVTLRNGAYHEDVGYGLLENAKSKGAALDKCKKEAITDALKRTLRNFGNLLGNCLYDKSYAQEVVKIKVPPAKFDKNELYRRPEFEERMTDAPHGQAAVPEPSSSKRNEPRVKVEHELHQPGIPITYVPRHLRQEMVAAAQQAQAPARALATPPHNPPTHPHAHASTSVSGTIDASTNRGLPPVDAPKPGGLATPIQTPVQAQPPPPPRGPPPRVVATSPLARMRSAPERSASFSESMPVRAGSADAADQDMCDAVQGNSHGNDEDEDAFPLSTQDDAFLATVDLGEGDLGRPIDFEEGIGGVSMVDSSMLEPGSDCAGESPAAPPQPHPQVRDRAGSGSSAGSSSGGPPKTKEVQAQPATKPPLSTSTNGNGNGHVDRNASASGGQSQSHPRSGPPSTASASTSTPSTSSIRAGPPVQDVKRSHSVMTSMGGFHFPPGTKPPMPQQQHAPKPVAAPCVRTTSNTPHTGPTNGLKRSVDVMQTGSGSSTRSPIQGMGLAQRQQQQQQQNSIARRQLDNSEGNDPKRLKR